MTQWHSFSTLRLLLPALLVFSFGCIDIFGDWNGEGGGEGGEEHNQDREEQEAPRDTSDYDGLLTWSKASRNGVFVWDLPNSKYVFEYDEAASGNYATAPALSADGSTFAFAREHSQVLTASLSTVELRDLKTGDEFEYTSEGLDADEVRVTYFPSLSADGKRVAVSESHAKLVNGVPGNGSALSIEVWDRETDERIVVTSGNQDNRLLKLSADGERVLYINGKDLWISKVETDADPLHVVRFSDLGVDDVERLMQPGHLSVSDDLKWVAYLAPYFDSEIFYLVDTDVPGQTQSLFIDPVDVEFEFDEQREQAGPVTYKAVNISADGSTVAFSIGYADTTATPPKVGQQVLVAKRENMSDTTLAVHHKSMAMLHGVALSADGSQLAYAYADNELWVSHADGSNPKLVVSKKEKRVGPDFGGTMFLSF